MVAPANLGFETTANVLRTAFDNFIGDLKRLGRPARQNALDCAVLLLARADVRARHPYR